MKENNPQSTRQEKQMHPVTYTLLTGEIVIGHPIKVDRDTVVVKIDNLTKRTLRTSEVRAVRRK